MASRLPKCARHLHGAISTASRNIHHQIWSDCPICSTQNFGRSLHGPSISDSLDFSATRRRELRATESIAVLSAHKKGLPPFQSSGDRFYSSDSTTSAASDGRRLRVYTRTGDGGESSLYDGQRRRKDDPTFEALGDVDELNSALGLAHAHCAGLGALGLQLEEVQARLLDAGSAVATPLTSASSKKVARVKFSAATVGVLEQWIDEMDEELPQLTAFILPSGGLPAASLHMARAICRRAERKVVTLVEQQVVDRSVAQFLNRLSDYLFTAARYAAMKLRRPETVWKINKR